VLRDRDTTGNGVLNERLYALQDANRNVTAVSDTTGTVQERYAYTAYGWLVILTPPFGLRGSSWFDWETCYAGYRHDNESALYYIRHRHYHALAGTFVTRDPLALSGADSNLYCYVVSNPVNAADPMGLQPYYEPKWWEADLPCLPEDRMPRPGRRPAWTNACTGVPDFTIDGTDLRYACIVHDFCYQTCGKTKKQCDDEFLENMRQWCESRYRGSWNLVGYLICAGTAGDYRIGVQLFGMDAWISSQREQCVCPYRSPEECRRRHTRFNPADYGPPPYDPIHPAPAPPTLR
jgi:RHS repeat-associated protein